jgi:hypothetical protein
MFNQLPPSASRLTTDDYNNALNINEGLLIGHASIPVHTTFVRFNHLNFLNSL